MRQSPDGNYHPRLRTEHITTPIFPRGFLRTASRHECRVSRILSSSTSSIPTSISCPLDIHLPFPNVSSSIFACAFHQPVLANLPFFSIVHSSRANKISHTHTVRVTILNQVKTRSMASNEDWTNASHHHPQINSTKSPMASTMIGKLETAWHSGGDPILKRSW